MYAIRTRYSYLTQPHGLMSSFPHSEFFISDTDGQRNFYSREWIDLFLGVSSKSSNYDFSIDVIDYIRSQEREAVHRKV
jgi:hypothetical protein